MATPQKLDKVKPDKDLGQKIRAIRGGKTQEKFASELGVAYTRVSTWEKGQMPPNDKLVLLGNIATDVEMRLYFWKKAGLKTDEIEEAVRTRFLKHREEAVPGEAMLLAIHGGKNGGVDKRRIAYQTYPATRVPNPESTFCLELENSYLPGLLQKGSLAVIDGSRTELLHAPNGLLAIRFDPMPNLVPVFHGPRPAKALFNDISSLDDDRENQLLFETSQKHLNEKRVGVRFGWVRPMYAGEHEAWADDPDRPWCYVLQPAAVDGVAHAQSGIPLELTGWRQGSWPSSETEIEQYLLKSVHVLGTVIGWIAAHGPEPQPLAIRKKVKI